MKHRALTWALVCTATLFSWLIAIVVLVVALRFLPVTPGYLPDHLE
jgi:uncharacterized membrane protein